MSKKSVDSLKLWNKNPRGISTQKLELLKKYLKKYGLLSPLKVTPDGEVLGGNHRLKAIKELGWDEVWVKEVNPKNDKEKLEIALIDNQEFAHYLEDKLQELVINTPDLKLEDFSVSLTSTPLTDFQPEPEIEEDEAPELDETETVSELGEVYQLGRHRLMCGDATKIEDVEKLMGGKKADILVTDPPYNVAYVGKTEDALTIQNDNMDDSNFRQFLIDSFSTADVYMKPGAAFYIWHADTEGYNFRGACRDVGWQVRQCLIWNKNVMVMGRQDYHWKHEPCLYGWKEGTHSWYSDRKQTTVWDIDRPSRADKHPTMKPIELCSRAIRNSSKSNDIVLDLFGGSGSTLITCEQTDRTCYMMELDPKYCDVIRKRYHKFVTGSEEGWQDV